MTESVSVADSIFQMSFPEVLAMVQRHIHSRRDFLGGAAVAGAMGVAVPHVVSAAALGRADGVGANDRIRLGLIGAGSMGTTDLNECLKCPGTAVTAICDVWKDRAEALAERQEGKPKTFHDYRDLLQQDDVDAVIIATPHHWHCRQAVDACEAGKDLYVEKPLTLHFAESRAVKNAVLEHERVLQMGTQMHASETYRQVVQWARSGKLGKIGAARTFLSQNMAPDGEGFPPDGDPPEGLDWGFWVGPAPIRPFNINIVKDGYSHTLFLDYGGGRTCGMANHILDLPYWALNLEFPLTTTSVAGKYAVRDNTDAPDTHEVTWEFPDLVLTWSMSQITSFGFNLHDVERYTRHVPEGVQRRLGYYLHGVEGTVFGNYSTHQVVPQTAALAQADPPEETIPPSPGHWQEWLDCVRSREEPSCGATYAHKVNLANMLANLSMKVGRPIRLDPATEAIIDDSEAVRMSQPEYRHPWKFPEEYL